MPRYENYKPLILKGQRRKWDDYLDKVIVQLRALIEGVGKFPDEWQKYAKSKDSAVAQLAQLAGKDIVCLGLLGDRLCTGNGQAAFREFMRYLFKEPGEWGSETNRFTWWDKYQEDYQTEFRAKMLDSERDRLHRMGFGKENWNSATIFSERERILGRFILQAFMSHAELDWQAVGDLFMEGAHKANKDDYDPNTVLYDLLGYYIPRRKPRDAFESTIIQAATVNQAFSKDSRDLRPAEKNLVTYETLKPYIEETAKAFGFDAADVEHFKQEGMAPSEDAAHTRRGFWTETFRSYARALTDGDTARLTRGAFHARITSLARNYKLEADGGLRRENKVPWSAGEKDVFVAQLIASDHKKYDWNAFADAMEVKLASEGVPNVRRTQPALRSRLDAMKPYWMWRVLEAGGDLVKSFGKKFVEQQGGAAGLRKMFKDAEIARQEAESAKQKGAIIYEMEGVQALREGQGIPNANSGNAVASSSKSSGASKSKRSGEPSAKPVAKPLRRKSAIPAKQDKKGKGKAVEIRADTDSEEEDGYDELESSGAEGWDRVAQGMAIDADDELDELDDEVDELEDEVDQLEDTVDDKLKKPVKLKSYVGKQGDSSSIRVAKRRTQQKSLAKPRQLAGQLKSTKSTATRNKSSAKVDKTQASTSLAAPGPSVLKQTAVAGDQAGSARGSLAWPVPSNAQLKQRQALAALGSFKKRKLHEEDDDNDQVQLGPSEPRDAPASTTSASTATATARNQEPIRKKPRMEKFVELDSSSSDDNLWTTRKAATTATSLPKAGASSAMTAAARGRAQGQAVKSKKKIILIDCSSGEDEKESDSSASSIEFVEPSSKKRAGKITATAKKQVLEPISLDDSSSTSEDDHPIRASVGYKKRPMPRSSDDDEE
ncbi:hypothetical protein JCM10908_006001 [Rhodotorula pacifica]|uniref:uncharacterized protein n=1 Tax=Rhodotorula pacifica TaxID=1495444 RepID=UPI00316BB7B3